MTYRHGWRDGRGPFLNRELTANWTVIIPRSWPLFTLRLTFAYRPPELRSDFIIRHEAARAFRMCDVFETEVEKPVMNGPVGMAQLTLACVLHGRNNRPEGFNWREGRPKLAAWIDKIGERPSVANTLPPPPER